MKEVQVPGDAAAINALLEQARDEDLVLRSADGSEFLLVAVDEFDDELARTRQNAKLMALLDARGQQAGSIPLAEVRQQLGL